MELHGFDAPTTDVHSMYTTDSSDDATATTDSTSLDDDGGLDSGHDSTDSSDSSGGDTIDLEIKGQHYEVEATLDVDGDGTKDTAMIPGGEDGQQVGVADTDGDGEADKAILVDDQGKVLETATFDQESGEWHVDSSPSVGTASSDTSDSDSSDAGDRTDSTGTDNTGDAGDGSALHEGTPTNATLEINGEEYTRTATLDSDGDGRGDTAVIETEAGERVTVTDTDHDGRYDESALIDESGQVVDTMHVDPTTGEWVSGTGEDAPYEVGDTVLDEAGSTSTAGVDSGTTTASTGVSSGASNTISVEAGGRTHEEAATLDVDRDGVNETAVVQGADGTQVAFSDTDGDGEADQAVVFDQQGQVVGRAVFDAATGEWQNV